MGCSWGPAAGLINNLKENINLTEISHENKDVDKLEATKDQETSRAC